MRARRRAREYQVSLLDHEEEEEGELDVGKTR
jgi:hypothetical protein